MGVNSDEGWGVRVGQERQETAREKPSREKEREKANTNHIGHKDRERERECGGESESEREIKAAEGSGWERGNSQPFSHERNPANLPNDKHVSVSPIPGSQLHLCVCVCTVTDTLTPDTDTADDDIHLHTHTDTSSTILAIAEEVYRAQVLTDTGHHTLNTTLEPDNKAPHLLFFPTPLFSFSPVLTCLCARCSLTLSAGEQNNLSTWAQWKPAGHR